MTGDDTSLAVLGGTCCGPPSFTVDAQSMVRTKTVNVAGKCAVPAGAPLGAGQKRVPCGVIGVSTFSTA